MKKASYGSLDHGPATQTRMNRRNTLLPEDLHRDMRRNKQRDLQGSIKTLLCDPVFVPTPKKVQIPQTNFSKRNKEFIRRLAAENSLTKGELQDVTDGQGFSRNNTTTNIKSSYSSNTLRASASIASEALSRRALSDSTSVSRPALGLGRLPACATDKNFVRINSDNAKLAKVNQPRPTRLEQISELPRASAGAIPTYLLKRQEEWKAKRDLEEILKNKPFIPDGCQIMDETEKAAVLEELRNSYVRKERELAQLPVTRDSQKIRNKRCDIESELELLEKQIEMLSKPIVYVPIAPSGDKVF